MSTSVARDTFGRPFDSRQLRDVAAQFASGVTIVAVASTDAVHGMTANSFVSVALEPPLVLISIANHARILALVIHAGRFGISVLAEHQRAIAQQFCGRGKVGLETPFEMLG